MNIPLKKACAVSPVPQYMIAHECGRSGGWLSMVIREMAEPSESEKEKIASRLGHSVSELFPEKQPVEAA